MEGEIPGTMAMLRCASNGDRNALEELGLEEGFEYNIPVRFDPKATSSQKLEEEIDDLVFFAEAANCLHMDKSETVARKAISHDPFFLLLVRPNAKNRRALQRRGSLYRDNRVCKEPMQIG